MIEFITENLLLLPFLFLAYLVMEWVEAHAGDALERKLGRIRFFGPLFGAVAGVFPQCGFSAASASLYAGGVVTLGTLLAVFLSTSDELILILLTQQSVPKIFLCKLVAYKVVCACIAGFAVNALLSVFGRGGAKPNVGELCAHSHCSCSKRKGIVVPALIHTAEIFVFLLIVSGIVMFIMRYCGGKAVLEGLVFNKPVIGELFAGLVGLIPSCAVSAASAKVYAAGGMSAGALVSSSLTGAGVGILVLFRTNRRIWNNIAILASLYAFGVVFGCLSRFFL